MNTEIEVTEAVRLFIESCNRDTHSKIIKTIDLLCDYGHELRMPHVKIVMHGIHELRILGRESVRIFYVFYQSRAILFYAIEKKTQRLSKQDMQHILRKMGDLSLD